MPSLLTVLCLGTIILAVVTVLGHGLWLAVAAVFRGLAGGPPAPADRRPERPTRRHGPAREAREPCARCGWKLEWYVRDCPRCGLDRDGVIAAELADLEAMARQLERFQKRQALPKDEVERLWEAVQARHRRLVGAPDQGPATPVAPAAPRPTPPEPEFAEVLPVTPIAAPQPPPRMEEAIREVLPIAETAPLAVPPQPAPEAAELPWVRLERLLAGCQDLANLSASERVRGVLLFRQSPAGRLDSLPAPSLWLLARLLREAGRTDDALGTYRRLVDRYPQHPELAQIVLEAARFAAAKDRVGEAERLLRQAQAQNLSPPERAEVEALLATLPVAATPAPEVRRQTAPPPVPPAVAVVEPVPAPRPGRSLGGLLAGFMEEKNILWGELVGGLLIVGGSIALVISLWNTLQENPYFPFGIFAAVTAALFGAGLYTLHHWKLEATSRGLLVIATLLVPLCFTVLPSMLEEAAAGNLELLIAAGGLVAFTALIHQGGRVLVPGGGLLLTLAVLGCSASQLLAARLLGTQPAGPGLLILLGCLPVACAAVSVGLLVRRLIRDSADAGRFLLPPPAVGEGRVGGEMPEDPPHPHPPPPGRREKTRQHQPDHV